MTDRIHLLLGALGLDRQSFEDHLEWVLSEALVQDIAALLDEETFRLPDAMKRFRQVLFERTGRRWSQHDYEILFTRVQQVRTKHYRERIRPEDLAILKDQEEWVCAECGARPPEVDLHIDHIFPASKGGSSKRENLQFLCAKHNLEKSDKVTKGDPWLDLR